MFDQALYQNILLDQNYISPADAAAASAYEAAGRGTFIEYLLQNDILNESTLGLAIAEHYNTTFADLGTRPPSDVDMARIPEDISKKYRIVFIDGTETAVRVASDTPDNAELPGVLATLFPNIPVTISFAFTTAIDTVLSHYQKALNTRFSDIIKGDKRVAPEIFDEIIKDAISFRASDIHFEPALTKAIVRFRVDGMLRLAGEIPREYYENVLNRIKIQSNLRTDEHFAPQDGAIRFVSAATTVDLRVSIVPTLDGEKVVIRVLAEYVKGLTFADLGFSDRNIALLEAAARKPFGMIIVSGPTGSGKTTTLYSLIKKLNTPEVNITSIEDPVEYRMIGANQIQVNPKTDLTFAKGLRAIVRQDPNIILVGEIRDTETAETAVNAALTGHLLLSTFHANDAATTIPRLLEMSIEPFLLASTVELIIAQRLVRTICESCKQSYKTTPAKLTELFPQAKNYFSGASLTLYKGNGCTACNNTGYLGRTSIIEIISVDKSLRELIVTRPSAGEIWDAAKRAGAQSLFDDGISKVKVGVTTVEEILRVASPDQTIQIPKKV